MKKKKLTSLIVLVFVLLCNCDYFKSLCEPENDPKKQPTTLQNIVNNATDGEIINLEEWENVTDYTATIDKKLTIKSGNLNGASLTVKAENVKLEKMQNLSVETSSRLTIKDSKLNNLLLGGNAQSRSNTTAEINVILENCEIAEKIKINSQAKLNITGKKTKIAKIVVAVVETLCKIFCADELDTTEIKDIIVDEDNKKLENVKVSKAYKIIYHSNCDEQEDIEDFFSPDDGTISLPTDIFNRDGYIFTGWYKDEACKQIFDNFDVSDKTADINVYAGWTKYIPGSGVYKYSINIEDIPESGPWNGSRTSPAFSILLLTEKLIDASIKHGDFYFSNDAYQIQTRASENLRITDTSKTGNYAVYGEVPTNIDSIPENDKYKYYSGVAATVTDTTLEIFVDMSKIVKTELKVFRKSESSTAQEEFVTENTLIDLTDYKPYIIALGTKGSLFTSLTWDADLMAMTAGATFPTDLQQSPPTTGNTNSVTVTDNNNNTETINFSELSTKLSTLSAGTYTLKVSGTITNNTITEIANAMNSNTEAKINLDLSDTDGLTEIPKKSFQFCNNLISINIPKSVTIISSQSFEDSGLTSVILPNNLQNIGKYAFFKCSNLASIEIPDSVTTIGTYAFYNCSSLTSVTFKDANNWYCTSYSDFTGGQTISVTNATENATYLKETNSDKYWYKVTTFSTTADDIESVITNLSAGTYTLKVSGEITSTTITTIATAMNSNTESKINLDLSGANGLTEIPENAFCDKETYNGCTSLLSINIPDSVTTIGDFAFEACYNLASVTIGNKVTTIGDYAFDACSNLASVTIGNKVTSIGDYAFSYCSGLTSINIPDSVESIGILSFLGCNNLTTFEVGTNNSNFSSSNDKHILFNKDKTVLIAYPSAKDDVTTILDSDNVTTIGDHAFFGCSNLTSIKIPDSVTTIGTYAFSNCSNLTNITIGNKVTSIGDYAFSSCSSLTSIEIPNSVTTIGTYAFSFCSGLTSIEIPNSVTTIGDYVFYNCSNLTNVTINNGVTTIGQQAFHNCSSLKSITIPDSVESIESFSFVGCNNLKTVIIGSGVKNIYNNVFEGCSNLEDVTFRDTNNWYYTSNSDFSSGEEIVVTDTAQNAENLKDTYSEYYWYRPTELTATADTVAATINGLSAGTYTLKVSGEITSTTITTIATAMNSNTEAKINLDLSGANGLTEIPENAFCDKATYNGCTRLLSINIPDNVTTIGDYAFSDCSSLTRITIPNSVTSIGYSAFSCCLSLTSIEIPNSVTTIGSNAFYYCENLTSVTFNNTSGWYYTNNSDFTGGEEIVVTDPVQNAENLKDTYSGYYWYRPTELTATADTVADTIRNLSAGTYTLKVTGAITNDTITTIATAMNNNTKAKINLDLSGTTELNEIPENAFYIDNTLNDNLISIIIPDSVTSIGEYAFRNCNITSVTIGSGVTSIGSGAFTICSKLKEVIIPNNIKIEEIKDYAFSNCYILTGFTIPSCLTSIGNGAFSYCSSLTKFEVDTSNPNYSSSDDGTILFNKNKTELIACPSATGDITIPDGVTSIDIYAFYHCSDLKNITIPDSVTTIGEYAFANCSGLTSIEIPNSVTTIDAEAFSYCSGLTSIEIPNSVTTIGSNAFYYCEKLTSVTFKDTTSTWYYTDSENYTGGQTISVTNATENATYLKETYYDKYWYKESSTGGTTE